MATAINTRMVEINVTDACTLKCSQCNRCCDVAPSDKHISMDAITKMCLQMPHLERVCIAGGEPMLHPQIEDIVNAIKAAGVSDSILLLTNGMVNTELFDRIIDQYEIDGLNSGKDATPPKHELLMTVAPVDLNLYGIKPACECDILERCGLGYSSDGWYPCVLSATIGRVFGIPGVKDWCSYSEQEHARLLDETCRYCGYYLTSKRDTILPEFEYPKGMMSESWRKAIGEYNAKL